MIHLESLLVPYDATLREALGRMDRSGAGVAFAVDASRRLRGILTDGDLRRALLRGVSLDATVGAAMRADCVTLPVDAAPQTIAATLTNRIRVVPLLDTDGQVVDFASHFRHHRLPVAEPSLAGNELNYVVECLRTNWISSQGPFVSRFEETVAAYVRMPHAVAACNGTAALHLALAAHGIGPGAEVIVPDLTFAATINAVLHAGATPVLVDVDAGSWNIDPREVEAAITARTRAILPVHLYGQPCDMDALVTIAQRHGLLVIEDAAEALGALHLDAPVGGLGHAAAFSFFGNKLITTGEGGMVVFRDAEAARRARVLRDHGMDPARRYWHPEVGYNYRLTNLQAALGVAQMERVEEFIARKLELARKYSEHLGDVRGVTLPASRPGMRNVFWLYSILVEPDEAGLTRDDLKDRLLRVGIDTRPLFYPLHEMPPYRHLARASGYPNATRLARTGLSLPSAPSIRDEEVAYVVDAIRRVLQLRSMSRLAAEG